MVEAADSKEETTLWFKRVRAGEGIRETWEKACRVPECVSPQTRILYSDLTWRMAGDAEIGDTLLAFDEDPGRKGTYRKWRISVVESAKPVIKAAYRLLLSDDTTVTCSSDHLWLVTSLNGFRSWVRTEDLWGVSKQILKPLSIWDTDTSFGAGYLAGAFDGEGHLAYLQNGGFRVALGQKKNELLAKVISELTLRKYDFTCKPDSAAVDFYGVHLRGGLENRIRFLGSVRPERLLSKWVQTPGHDAGLFKPSQSVSVIEREFLGPTEVMAIQTSTRTFVAEGLASHNCYQYWRGRQRLDEFDQQGKRRAIHNKIHPDTASAISSLYFSNPTGRVIASPERVGTPRETITAKALILQNTGNYFVNDPETGFKENTDNAVKESRWAIGCVEVGYAPDFISNPMADRPPLKESDKTKVGKPAKDEDGLSIDEQSDIPALQEELKRLQQSLKGEVFYVKHIRAEQLVISPSDKPVLEHNDWVGYWEDYALEDVKEAPGYKNTDDLKASTEATGKQDEEGDIDRVRLYKIWDLRTRTKLVLAKGHDKPLMKKKFNRCTLKFLRFDVDPYHFFPIPPIYLKLNPQDGYNDSAEYLRMMRITTVPRYTYDEDAVTATEAAKFTSSDFNILIPRKQGTHQVIEAVNQPSTSGGAVQTLGLADKEFAEAGNSGGDPRLPQTRTATQAMIADTKENANESYEREIVSKWLASVIEELILLAVEHMNLPRWIAINVDLDSPDADLAALDIATTYQQIDAERLRSATLGVRWHVEVETESLSPVAETERGAKLMNMLQFISNPNIAALLSMAPLLLKQIIGQSGVKNGGDVSAIQEALKVIVQMNQAQAANGIQPPGISPMAKPTSPLPGPKGGPQPAAGGPPPPASIPHPQPPGVQ